jgi:hypothetical protein
MALSPPVRLSRGTSVSHLIIVALLLSFVAFDVFDVDGSNLPMATKAAATALEEQRPVEVERFPLHESLQWSASMIFSPESSASFGLWRSPSSAIRPLASFLHRVAHKAFPRATLPDPPPLV